LALAAESSSMNFLELKIIRQLGASITLFTGFLVVALGFWLCGAVLTPPQESVSFASYAKANRQPNSLPEDSSENSGAVAPIAFDAPKADGKTDTKVETLKLDCIRNGAHLELKSLAHQVRLLTDLCPGHRVDLEKSNIVNKANGFEATLFQLEKGGFSSDYINLVDGANEIVMQLTDSRGQKISAQVAISRTR